jgi:hypothetical protein
MLGADKAYERIPALTVRTRLAPFSRRGLTHVTYILEIMSFSVGLDSIQ